MKKLTILISALAITVGSCKKSDYKLDNNTLSSQQITISEYESFGIMHNEGLDNYKIVTNFSTKSDEFKISYFVDWGEDYMDAANFENSAVKTRITSAWNLVKNDIVDNDYLEVKAGEYYSQEKISVDVRDYLIELSQINESNYSIGTTIIQISALEENIMADLTLSSQDRDLLMGTCAILRYSSNYWNSEILDTQSPWQVEFPYFGDPISVPVYGFYRLRRAARDAYGWLDGFIGEPIAGTSHGGTATIYSSLYSASTPI